MSRLIAALVIVSFVASCASLRQSRLNPSNWFGKSRAERTAIATSITPATVSDARPLVGEVTTLKVERLPGGAIIRVMGLPATQGNYDAELVALNNELPDKGTLTYEFRLKNPTTPTAAGTKRSREVLVGRFVSDQTLIGVRRIVVIAQNNRRSVRR